MGRPEEERGDPQKEAIRAPCSVAVVAGAGTGKTHTLVERYLYHLKQPDGLSPLEVAAVTFTEGAADELRARVRKRATEESLGEETIAGLEAAQIGTIHALCARICREHPDEADAPLGFGILDEARGRLWSAERLVDALENVPAEDLAVVPYELLVAALPKLLADPIPAKEALACGPEGWEKLATEVREGALRTLLEDPAVRKARSLFSSISGKNGDNMEKYRAAAVKNFDELEGLLGKGAPASKVRACLEGLRGEGNIGGSKDNWAGGDLSKIKEAAGLLRKKVKGELDRGIVVLELGPADQRLEEALPVLRRCFEAARQGLKQAKRRARVLDFADLEERALEALQNRAVREYYSERWKAILVDEFQDTNAVQAELLELLAEGGAKLTIVGDEKQAIYGFRRADASVFKQFLEKIANEGGHGVTLSESFRTHGGLIEKTNVVLGTMLGELRQDLEARYPEAPHEAPHVRSYALEAQGKGGPPIATLRLAEAKFVAGLVKEMMDAGTLVRARDGGTRPARPGDFAVLSRVWDPLAALGEALEAAGVPAVHAGGGSLLETREAKDGMALLRFLSDPDDDVALFALLRSPFLAIDDRTLNRMALEREEREREESKGEEGKGEARAKRDRPSWWSWLGDQVLEENLEHARKPLGSLLGEAGFEAPSALLATADRLTGYTAVLANLAGAARREADWRGFVELVRALERPHEGVFGVARALKRLAEEEVEIARPKIEAEDAVSLMTVHAAKGREWPVVIVPDLARMSPNRRNVVLFDPELGAALDLGGKDEEGMLYRLLRDRKEQEEREEARRVLYVASTRARDHLVLTSTSSEARGFCGTTFLQQGLLAAGIDWESVPFDSDDAVPQEPPPKSVPEPEGLLIRSFM